MRSMQFARRSGNVARVEPNPTRVVILGIGESGLVGYGVNSGLPTGYPPATGALRIMADDFTLKNPVEPIEDSTNYVDAVLADPLLVPVPLGVGWAGIFCWKLQQRLGAAYQVIYCPCGRSGTKSSQWAADLNRTTLYGASVARASAALKQSRTVLGAIIIDQGINDSNVGEPAVAWQTNWTAILSQLRTDLGIPNTVPVYYRKHCTTKPTGSDATLYTNLLAQEVALQSLSNPKRVMVTSPEGPWTTVDQTHLDTPGNIVLADNFLSAYASYPSGNLTPDDDIALDLTNLVGRWDPSLGLTDDGSGRASQWLDQISGYALLQATAGKRPLIDATALNSTPGLTFAGGTRNDWMTGAAALAALLDNTDACTIYATCKGTAPGGFAAVVGVSDGGSNFGYLGLDGSGKMLDSRNGGGSQTLTSAATPFATLTGPLVASWVFTGTRVNAFINGDQYISGVNTESIGTCNVFSIGGVVGAAFLNGSIGDILVYTGAHSVMQRTKVQRWLMNRVGVGW